MRSSDHGGALETKLGGMKNQNFVMLTQENSSRESLHNERLITAGTNAEEAIIDAAKVIQ